jgi:hypothetical protein
MESSILLTNSKNIIWTVNHFVNNSFSVIQASTLLVKIKYFYSLISLLVVDNEKSNLACRWIFVN